MGFSAEINVSGACRRHPESAEADLELAGTDLELAGLHPEFTATHPESADMLLKFSTFIA